MKHHLPVVVLVAAERKVKKPGMMYTRILRIQNPGKGFMAKMKSLGSNGVENQIIHNTKRVVSPATLPNWYS